MTPFCISMDLVRATTHLLIICGLCKCIFTVKKINDCFSHFYAYAAHTDTPPPLTTTPDRLKH